MKDKCLKINFRRLHYWVIRLNKCIWDANEGQRVKEPIHMGRLLNPNVLRKDTKGLIRSGKQFLLHMLHPSCFSYYKPDDKRRIRKGPDCDTKKIYLP